MSEAKTKAKVIYVAHVRKESKQPEIKIKDVVDRPREEERGDLISYYNQTPDLNSFHARCLRVKSDCTVNLGIKFLDESEEKRKTYDEQLTRVNDDGQTFQEVISRVSLDYETTGNGYLEIVRAQDKSIAELYFAPSINTYRRRRDSEYPFVIVNPGGDEVDFADASGHQFPHLLNHVRRGAAAMAPPHPRDDAEAAGVIAALGDLHIGKMLGGQPEPGRGVIRDVSGTPGDFK